MQSVRVPPYQKWAYPSRDSNDGATTREDPMRTRLINDTDELECAQRSPTPRVRWALAGLSLALLMPSLDTSNANVGLPTLAESFGATFQQVQWIVLAYLIAVTTLIVGVGRLGDLLGRRRLLLAGIGLFTAASVLCGAAPSLAVLVAARAVQGLGAAIMLALTIALVGETVPKSRTGSAMGLLGSMSAIGTTFGPSLGGILIASFGWRMIFLVNVPLGALALLLVLRTLPADRRATTAQSPLPRLAMLGDATLRSGLAMSVLVSTVMMSTLIVGPFYLARALGLDAARVGLVMSAGPLVAAMTGVLSGRIVDRFGARRMTSVGLAGLMIGLVALALAPQAFGVAGYLAAIVVVTAHYALFQTANNTSVMTAVRADERGVVSGMLGLARNVGLIAGASVMGALFAFASATSDVSTAPPSAVAAGMQVTFVVAAMLVLAALGIATTIGGAARRTVEASGSPAGTVRA
jgi:MFS family permease